jgi:hypothetical protein
MLEGRREKGEGRKLIGEKKKVKIFPILTPHSLLYTGQGKTGSGA